MKVQLVTFIIFNLFSLESALSQSSVGVGAAVEKISMSVDKFLVNTQSIEDELACLEDLTSAKLRREGGFRGKQFRVRYDRSEVSERSYPLSCAIMNFQVKEFVDLNKPPIIYEGRACGAAGNDHLNQTSPDIHCAFSVDFSNKDVSHLCAWKACDDVFEMQVVDPEKVSKKEEAHWRKNWNRAPKPSQNYLRYKKLFFDSLK